MCEARMDRGAWDPRLDTYAVVCEAVAGNG